MDSYNAPHKAMHSVHSRTPAEIKKANTNRFPFLANFAIRSAISIALNVAISVQDGFTMGEWEQ